MIADAARFVKGSSSTLPFRSVRLRPWMLVSAAWIGPAILGAISEIAERSQSGAHGIALGAILFTSGDWLLYGLLTPAVFLASARWPLTRPIPLRNLFIHLGLALLFCVVWAGAGTLLKLWLLPSEVWGGPKAFFVGWIFVTLPFGLAVYLGVAGAEHAIRYFFEARERATQMARLSDQLANARLTALQATVNPHFFFNTLNTIGVLVRDRNEPAATHVIEEFAEVMRRMLSRHQTPEVLLADEMELVRHYLAVERARFPDRLRVTMEIDDDVLSAAVPSFAIQQLVDNAVRHGIARRAEAGALGIVARREGEMVTITVRDDGPGFPEAPRTGHGLDNTRERLRALYGDRASLVITKNEPAGTVATMRVPYREVEGVAVIG